MTDIERAYKALRDKLEPYNTLFQYVDGQQPLVYSTEKLRTTFKNVNASFQQNWVSVVVNSTVDRLMMKGWTTENAEANTALTDIFNKLYVGIEANDVHKAAVITHEAFVIAWKDEEGELELYYNDPRMCHMFYQADNPKRKEFAAKWYVTSDKKYHMVLYYPDRLEYYITRELVKNGVPKNANAFIVEQPNETNPFDEVPVFHFRTDRRGMNSDITNIITLQDAVNKLLADLMIAAEFGAFKQRWIITNSETLALKNAPNEIWTIAAGDGQGQATQVGQFDETPLSNFLEGMDKLANSIAIISRTPKHYFFAAGGNVSGEALIAMESPLVAKVERHQANFGVTWSELAAFLLKLSNGETLTRNDIKIVWEPAQSVQPLTEAQTIKTNTEAGVPLESALRWSGKNEYEIQAVMKEVEKDKKNKLTLATAQLEKLRLESASDNTQPDGSTGADEEVNNGE